MERKPKFTEAEFKKTLVGNRHMERLSIKPDPKEFDAALAKLIDHIEDHFMVSAFAFEAGELEADEPMTNLHNALDPRIEFDMKFLENYFNSLEDDDLGRELDDALHMILGPVRDIYFQAGVLVGARLKGATRAELQRMAENWSD